MCYSLAWRELSSVLWKWAHKMSIDCSLTWYLTKNSFFDPQFSWSPSPWVNFHSSINWAAVQQLKGLQRPSAAVEAHSVHDLRLLKPGELQVEEGRGQVLDLRLRLFTSLPIMSAKPRRRWGEADGWQSWRQTAGSTLALRQADRETDRKAGRCCQLCGPLPWCPLFVKTQTDILPPAWGFIWAGELVDRRSQVEKDGFSVR